MTQPRQRPYLACYCLLPVGETILLQRRFNTGYVGVALDCLQGHDTRFGRFHQEGWE